MVLPNKSFYFIRHGETDWNKRHVAMGQSDIALNATGISQAHQAAELLRNEGIASIACSPLKRAHETATIIADRYGLPLSVIEELSEASWGVMEGQDKGDGSWIHAWRHGEALQDAETFSDFANRVAKGVLKALELPEPVLIVSHGGVYWALQRAFALPFMDLANCLPVLHSPPANLTHPWRIVPVSEDYA
ncbi:MAG: histidine phosphatase family protein [Holosporales bacterium]